MSENSKYYGGIPEPKAELQSLQHTVQRMKEIIETLTRQRLPVAAATVTWQDLVDLELITPDQVPRR